MRYAHTNIVANDWKTLSTFYIDVFGCKTKPPERNLSGKWLDQATGLTYAKLEGIHLLLPGHGKNGPTLEIFSYKEMVALDPAMANYKGFSHIAFEVENVNETLEKALNNQATALGKITKKEVEDVGTLIFVYFRDPEGNIIEIQSWS